MQPTSCWRCAVPFPCLPFCKKTSPIPWLSVPSLSGFNYKFLADFLYKFDPSLSLIYDQSLWIIGLFFLLNIFLIGGIVYVFKNAPERLSFSDFWRGCSQYFWRFFRLSAYFLVAQAALLWVFVTIFQSIAKDFSILELYSEFNFINAFKYMLPIYLVLAVIISMIPRLCQDPHRL